jgi:hypothetical protein
VTRRAENREKGTSKSRPGYLVKTPIPDLFVTLPVSPNACHKVLNELRTFIALGDAKPSISKLWEEEGVQANWPQEKSCPRLDIWRKLSATTGASFEVGSEDQLELQIVEMISLSVPQTCDPRPLASLPGPMAAHRRGKSHLAHGTSQAHSFSPDSRHRFYLLFGSDIRRSPTH